MSITSSEGKEESARNERQPSEVAPGATGINEQVLVRSPAGLGTGAWLDITRRAGGVAGGGAVARGGGREGVAGRFDERSWSVSVVVSKWAAVTFALWILHTYAFRLRDVTTYMGIESAGEGMRENQTLLTGGGRLGAVVGAGGSGRRTLAGAGAGGGKRVDGTSAGVQSDRVAADGSISGFYYG